MKKLYTILALLCFALTGAAQPSETNLPTLTTEEIEQVEQKATELEAAYGDQVIQALEQNTKNTKSSELKEWAKIILLATAYAALYNVARVELCSLPDPRAYCCHEKLLAQSSLLGLFLGLEMALAGRLGKTVPALDWEDYKKPMFKTMLGISALSLVYGGIKFLMYSCGPDANQTTGHTAWHINKANGSLQILIMLALPTWALYERAKKLQKQQSIAE